MGVTGVGNQGGVGAVVEGPTLGLVCGRRREGCVRENTTVPLSVLVRLDLVFLCQRWV